MKLIKWYHKILLFFKPAKISIDLGRPGGDKTAETTWKKIGDKVFITRCRIIDENSNNSF